MNRSVTHLVLATVAALVLATSASAALIYGTGFEAPTIVPGTLVGQDGWLAGSGSASSQAVVNTFSHTGSQSLYWDNSTTFSSFYSVRRSFNGQAGAITPATPLSVSVWTYVVQGSGIDRLYSLLLTNSGTGTMGSTTLGVSISGTGDIRAGTTWSATYSGAPDYSNPAMVGSWVKLDLRYDGVGGSVAVYDSSNALLHSENFAAVTLGNANGAGVNSWNVNLGTDYNGTAARLGRGYHDDLVVQVIPEPASLLALGSLALLALRRR